jgi:hypothetical protein
MWSEDLKNIKEQASIARQTEVNYITSLAQPIANKIISFLGDHKEYILLSLSKRASLHSDAIIPPDFGCVETIPQNYRSLVGTKAGDIVSETLGIWCYVTIQYDYDLEKYKEDALSFELRLRKWAS